MAKPPKQTEFASKLPVITIVPDANPIRTAGRRGPAAAARPRTLHSTTSTWNASFFDCCCSVAPTYCCVVTCCPCTTIASVKESLGGGYERTLLYFGGLVFGVLFSIGFAASNNDPKHEVDNTAPPPPDHSGVSDSMVWEAAALALLLAFLFGVWRLRTETRQTLGIQGSQLNDCLSSFFCCFCVISQLHLELRRQYEEPPTTRQVHYHRHQGGDDLAATRPVDTLAPYAVM